MPKNCNKVYKRMNKTKGTKSNRSCLRLHFFLNRWSSFFDIKKFIINVDRRLLTLFVATRDHSEGGHFNLSKHLSSSIYFRIL